MVQFMYNENMTKLFKPFPVTDVHIALELKIAVAIFLIVATTAVAGILYLFARIATSIV